MAKEDSKVVLERTYTIPLSRELLKVPYYKKAKKAVRAVQAFISKHMKSTDVRMGRHLNMKLWENGMKNPPKNIKVTTSKDDKGVVLVELFGAPKDQEKAEKKAAKKSKKVVDVEAKTISEKSHQSEEQTTKAQNQEKEEVSELKKELPKTHHHPQKQPKVAKQQPQHQQAPKSV